MCCFTSDPALFIGTIRTPWKCPIPRRKDDVFFKDGDRQRYLQLLLEYSDKHGLKTLAYCLMTIFIHLVCIPKRDNTLSSVFSPLDLRYTQHFNQSQRIGGRLWQRRPVSCALDDDHLWAAIRYAERNPVRARMVLKAEQYAWSSTAAHYGLRHDPVLSPFPSLVPIIAADWPA
jgi:putative transposase